MADQNGSQALFWDRPEVLYLSLHRFPFYPGTGDWDEVGGGRGEGRTVNLPLPPELGDADYDALFQHVVEPIVHAFAPELIVVSAGFDTYRDNPIGGMGVTTEGYKVLSARVWQWAERHCPGRALFVLEGGYHPAGVKGGVLAALAAMRGETPAPSPLGPAHPRLADLLHFARATHRARWPVLGQAMQ